MTFSNPIEKKKISQQQFTPAFIKQWRKGCGTTTDHKAHRLTNKK